MDIVLDIRGLTKQYPARGGAPAVTALDHADLAIGKGEIFALLGPNGAGKTTLIGAVCGLVRPTSGTIMAFGKDMRHDWRGIRRRIGLVPQELGFDIFEKVGRSIAFSRGLFGAPADPGRVETVLRSLQLWDKRDAQIRTLSGGMKRRVLIAKALAHDPELLFLDEPTAGVDVELRRDMWRLIDTLRDTGTTIILTTHYIEEAEEMADRVGIIDKGRILLVDDKAAMMARLGRTEARFTLAEPLAMLPPPIAAMNATLTQGGSVLCYRGGDGSGKGKQEIAELARMLVEHDIVFTALDVSESSLEDIFVNLVENGAGAAR
ncbi:ABC transporter ATP-binding protein [Croceicoccus sp. F390]|uniref:ABC transporter ATP-binding protein n=1 Tax=Croceicoccus esteveae TaxID=3075597 RepID=A0ABU2ZFL5_9SPHN|nr:ABC transporter ATP-binding protein [Croceicoccus sp. F390]MDT0575089.1 ABC transporter ATP-binding protein [Croceicoccus sp. F390]